MMTATVLEDFAVAVGTEGPVAIEGGRTRWDLGGEPVASTRLLRAPEGIVAYQPAEMTVRVRAGTTVAELHAELAARGQRSALPERPGGTVGGAIVVDENDHRRLGRGTVRASVLGVRYVSAEGRLISGGGATVKNVTGFDLPRILVGSLGTLGLLVEVVLRTNPQPGVSLWFRADDADPFALHDALYRPGAVLWDGRTTWVQLEGHGADVAAQTRVIQALGSFTESPEPEGLPPHRRSFAPAELRGLADGSGANRADLGRFVAGIGTGLVLAEHAGPVRPIDPAALEVSRRLKTNFDPTGRLNPGRMPGRAPAAGQHSGAVPWT